MIRAALTRHLPVILAAIIGGTVAFVGSFAVEPTYASATRLLVHGRDATFLSSTGDDLSDQPGVVDSSLSATLASTYAGVATSRAVATAVVDEIGVEETSPDGLLRSVVSELATWYRCTKAFLTSGFCADVTAREAAIVTVQANTSVETVGVNAGSAAGANTSYVLELRAIGPTPRVAQQVTDAAADQLIDTMNERFNADLQATIDALQEQLKASSALVRERAVALSALRKDAGADSSSAELAEVALAENSLTLAQANQATLATQVATAETRLAQHPVDLSRIDKAGLPTYPAAPKRYIYLALGLLLGGFLGQALVIWRARSSRGGRRR